MRIFASWSGGPSKKIAELLRTWIPQVVQDAEVYVSSQDIGKGERWLSSVGAHLAEIDFGIIVVTKANITAPWILFEAGALSKSVKGLVVPLLCGVDNLEAAKSPLTQFQYAHPVKSEMKDLILQVNALIAKPLERARLEASFDKWWPDFESSYKDIELPDEKTTKKESETEKLSNIEEALSQLMFETRRLRAVSERTEGYFEYKRATSPDISPDETEIYRQRMLEQHRIRKLRERELRLRNGRGEQGKQE